MDPARRLQYRQAECPTLIYAMISTTLALYSIYIEAFFDLPGHWKNYEDVVLFRTISHGYIDKRIKE